MSPVIWMMRALQPAKRVPIGALLGLVLLLEAPERALAEPPQGFLLHPAPTAVPELAFSDSAGEPLTGSGASPMSPR